MAQPYGNTLNAYYQRNRAYRASGGIHFAVDFAAPCGTEIAAIADGIVFAVDGPFGSPPHNLMIGHPQAGYASMYGHLLEAPHLVPGQPVKQGEIVALVGEPEAVRRENAKWIGPFNDERLTLVTCGPYTSNTHWVIVVARPL